MKKKQMWGFVVSSLFVMMLLNVPKVFSDESLSPPIESSSEVLESSKDSISESESDSFNFVESEIEYSNEENKTAETTEAIVNKTSDTSTIESQIEPSTEEEMFLKAVTIASEKVIGKYTTIVSKELVLWKDLAMQTELAKSSKYYLKTLYVEKEFTLSDGQKLVSLKDNNSQFVGYIASSSIKIVSGQQGEFQSIERYVSILGNYTIWNNFNWEEKLSAEHFKYQTFQAKGIYYHFNGSHYLSLYDNKNQWIGYINENGIRVGGGEQGAFNSISSYVSIEGTYTIWDNFDWVERASATKYQNQTLHAKGIYYHFNGSRYLSLYNNKNQWIGYINQNGVRTGSGQQGAFRSISRYVSIKGTYTIWNNFKWEERLSANQYRNQTFLAKGIYYHFNGSQYLSLYNAQGKWMGYINEQGTLLAKGAQGIHHDYGRYISVIGDYDFWHNFSWSSRVHSSKYQGQTFLAKDIYYHFNGSRYLSVYDNQGNWLGFLNAAGAKVVSGQQGAYQSYGKNVTIKTNSYAIWRNFSWSSKASGSHLGKTYLAKGVYHHFNGSRYLSLYDSNNRWIGYINSLATNDTYGDWVQRADKWYYLSKTGQVTKGWARIDNRWHYFDTNGVNIDTNQARFISRSFNDVLTITKKHQLFPSIMLAQAVLESNYGTSELATKANNFFGMKFKENEDEGKYEKYFVETKEYDPVTGEMVTIRAAFRKYPTRLASFEDNALKLRLGVSWDKNYYSGTWRENAKTYKDASKALTGRYATDPNYGEKLNTRIETWKLNQFD